jgi:hypothetical protein
MLLLSASTSRAYASLSRWVALAVTALLLAACAAPSPPAAPLAAAKSASTPASASVAQPARSATATAASNQPVPAPQSGAAVSPGATALRDGVTAFETGQYRRAEAKLADAIRQGLYTTAEQVRVHKTQAFLFCVTKRSANCERSFQSAFAIDKNFDLTRAERGHPLWGPTFAKVKKAQNK